VLALYCTIHRPLDLTDSGIHTLQVGDAEEDFADFRDNAGDNISARNARFSELTGHYYVWKNRPSEMVGFCHYRRFLIPPELSQQVQATATKPYEGRGVGGVGNYASGYLLEPHLLHKAITECDYRQCLQQALGDTEVLLPHPNALPKGGFLQQYGNAHSLQPFFEMMAILASVDNKLAREAHHFFTNYPRAHWNNLFVTRWDVFSEYSEFLFDILLKVDGRIETMDSAYQNRFCAFLSERLFNFWVWKRGLDIRHLDWCMTQDMEDPETEPHQRKARSKPG